MEECQVLSVHCKTIGFVASAIDTAKPDTFSDTFASEGFAASPIDTARLSAKFQDMSQNATPATQFALCHHFAQPCQCGLPTNTQHDTSEVLCLPRKLKLDTSKVLRLPLNMQRMFCERRKSIAPATQNDVRHVTKRVHMSRSARPATRNEATGHVNRPEMISPVKLRIGTAIAQSLRDHSDGGERLDNIERTHFYPHTPRVKREPLLRMRE